MNRRVATMGIAVLVGACGGTASPSSPPAASAAPSTLVASTFVASPAPASPSATPPIRIVGLGDSYMTAQNAQGKTFMDLFAAGLEGRSGRPVDLTLVASGDATTAAIKESTTHSDAVRTSVANADVIVLSVGSNDTDPFGIFPKGTCAPSQPLPACLEAYSPTLIANYETILTTIGSLRAGKPTAIRVTSMDDPFVGMPEAPTKSFARDFFAQVVEAQTRAVFEVAREHGAKTVDYLHVFSGEGGLDDPAKYLAEDHAHPGDAGIQVIAELLLALGLPELD